MKRKNLFVLIAVLTMFALLVTGCGGKEAEETTAAAEAPAEEVSGTLELTGWNLSSSTWSSPNGATVNLTATPNFYKEGQSAVFCIRLEGTDLENVPCDWDGTSYTAFADLEAADGYCYYVVLTAADGTVSEVALNTPNNITNEALINMATALNSYCHLLVDGSEAAGSKLTITSGTVQIQPPQIADDGQTITCTEAALVLNFNGEEVAREVLTLPEAGDGGLYDLSIAGVSFDIPSMEDDQQLTLRLDVTLSNGQTLTDSNGTWSYIDGGLVSAVG